MKPSDVQAEVDRITATRDAALTRLAERVRTALVIPACEKHGLRFLSGMGTYAFFPTDSANDSDNFQTAEEASERGYEMDGVFEALEVDVGDTLSLGHWVEDYPEST